MIISQKFLIPLAESKEQLIEGWGVTHQYSTAVVSPEFAGKHPMSGY